MLLAASFKITPLQMILLTLEAGAAVLTSARELKETVMTAQSPALAGRNQVGTKNIHSETALPLATFKSQAASSVGASALIHDAAGLSRVTGPRKDYHHVMY